MIELVLTVGGKGEPTEVWFEESSSPQIISAEISKLEEVS